MNLLLEVIACLAISADGFDTLTVAEVASIIPINAVNDSGKVEAIAKDIANEIFTAPELMYVDFGNGRYAITGSHRIAACEMLMDEDWSKYQNLTLEVLDVSDIVEEYCERTGHTLDSIDYADLRAIFKDTEYEYEIKENVEW